MISGYSRDVLGMFLKSVQNVLEMSSASPRDVLSVFSRCYRNILRMSSGCPRKGLAMCSGCPRVALRILSVCTWVAIVLFNERTPTHSSGLRKCQDTTFRASNRRFYKQSDGLPSEVLNIR